MPRRWFEDAILAPLIAVFRGPHGLLNTAPVFKDKE
jgi:hypothetical protein